jgi:hypothetical protein
MEGETFVRVRFLYHTETPYLKLTDTLREVKEDIKRSIQSRHDNPSTIKYEAQRKSIESFDWATDPMSRLELVVGWEMLNDQLDMPLKELHHTNGEKVDWNDTMIYVVSLRPDAVARLSPSDLHFTLTNATTSSTRTLSSMDMSVRPEDRATVASIMTVVDEALDNRKFFLDSTPLTPLVLEDYTLLDVLRSGLLRVECDGRKMTQVLAFGGARSGKKPTPKRAPKSPKSPKKPAPKKTSKTPRKTPPKKPAPKKTSKTPPKPKPSPKKPKTPKPSPKKPKTPKPSPKTPRTPRTVARKPALKKKH